MFALSTTGKIKKTRKNLKKDKDYNGYSSIQIIKEIKKMANAYSLLSEENFSKLFFDLDRIFETNKIKLKIEGNLHVHLSVAEIIFFDSFEFIEYYNSGYNITSTWQMDIHKYERFYNDTSIKVFSNFCNQYSQDILQLISKNADNEIYDLILTKNRDSLLKILVLFQKSIRENSYIEKEIYSLFREILEIFLSELKENDYTISDEKKQLSLQLTNDIKNELLNEVNFLRNANLVTHNNILSLSNQK